LFGHNAAEGSAVRVVAEKAECTAFALEIETDPFNFGLMLLAKFKHPFEL
jgi:hypothetical protein